MTPATARRAIETAFAIRGEPDVPRTRNTDLGAGTVGHEIAAQAPSSAPEASAAQPRAVVRTISVFAVAGLAWAATASLDTVVRGPCRVVSPAGLQQIAFLDAGIVSAVLVRAGDHVKRGQPLFRLDPVQADAEAARADALRLALGARAARLAAEAAGVQPKFDAMLTAAAPGQVAAERATYLADTAALAVERDAARARSSQAARAVAEAGALRDGRAEATALAATELASTIELADKGIVPLAELARARSALAAARDAQNAASASFARARAATLEARSDETVALLRARATAATALAVTRADRAAADRAQPALADRASRVQVVAPADGRIQRVFARTVGGIVRPADPVAELVPDGAGMDIEAKISPRDIARVHVGQHARVRIAAYDTSIFGPVAATVTSVSADAIAEPNGRDTYFLVRIRPDPSVRANARRLRLVAGMNGEADLLGPPRTLLAYLTAPLDEVRVNAFTER